MAARLSLLGNPKWWTLYLVGMMPVFAFMAGASIEWGPVSYFAALVAVAILGILMQRWLMRAHNIQKVVA